MSRKSTKRGQNNKNSNGDKSNNTPVIVAIIGLIGTLVTAYFGFRASSRPVETIINATQTAEARNVSLTQITSNSGTLTAGVKTGTVTGFMIYSGAQTPVIGYKLTLAGAEGRPYGQYGLKISPTSPEAQTDESGSFIFENIPLGKYALMNNGNNPNLNFIGVTDPSGWIILDIVSEGQVVNVGMILVEPP